MLDWEPKDIKTFRRNSLFTALLIVVGTLAGLSVVAAVSGWRLLNSVAESQQQLSNQNFPLITSAHSLAAQSAAVALLAPRVPQLRDQAELEQLFQQLERHLLLMESIPVRIGYLRDDDRIQTDTAAAIAKIRGQFSELKIIAAEKIELTGNRDEALLRVNRNIERIRKLINVAIARQADLIFEQTETLYENIDQKLPESSLEQLIRFSLDDEVLYDLNLRAARLESLLTSLPLTDSISQVNATKTQLDFQIRSMVSDVVGLSTEKTRQNFSRELNDLYQRLNSQPNLIRFELDLKQKNLEFVEVFGFLQNNVHQLNIIVGTLVEQVEIDTLNRSQQANQTAKLSTNLSLSIVILSILISAIIIVFI
ncbi:MAG: hypothetical protein AAF353_21035, partial [Pseudomonadota bacterium]